MRRLVAFACLAFLSSVAHASGINGSLLMFAEIPLREERLCLEREYGRFVGASPDQFAEAVWGSFLDERENISNIGATPSIRSLLLLLSDEQRTELVTAYNRGIEH